MKKSIQRLLVLTALAAGVGLFSTVSAQAQGNFDPAQFRQRQMDGYRESLDVKSEEDWKKLEVLITKVLDAQRDTRSFASFGGGGGGGGRGNRTGGGGGGGTGAGGGAGGGGGGNRLGGQTAPEVEGLRKAITDKAPADEVKEKLSKLRDARKEKETALTKAQDELRKALSPRQEASAVVSGLIK